MPLQTLSSPVEFLHLNTDHPGVLGRLSVFVLNRIDEKVFRFTAAEAIEECALKSCQIGPGLRELKKQGILVQDGKEDNSTVYRICTGGFSETEDIEKTVLPAVTVNPDSIESNLLNAAKNGFDPDILQLVRELLESGQSAKDERLGTMLALTLPQGSITLYDYQNYGFEKKWKGDMNMARQLGLVQKISGTQYVISRNLNAGPPELSKRQKEIIREIYGSFGNSFFSVEMIVAELDYEAHNLRTYLHRFRLLRILDCHRDKVLKYRFLVTPEKDPLIFQDSA